MFPGVNPRQMQKMMKQMGVKQDQLNAVRVEVFLTDGTKLVFDDPEISKVNMMGQEMYQLQGTPRQESLDTTPDISDEDVETVMAQTGATREEAQRAIDDAGGDLADAIMSLSE